LTEKEPKAQLTGTQRSPLTKTDLEHQYKMELMRDCQIYGKSLKECKLFFGDKGYSLSKSLFTTLRNELKSRKSSKNWFSKEALFAVEEDHMISVDRIRKVEDVLVKQLLTLMDEDKFETSVNFDTDKDGIVKLRVRNYNLELLIKLTSAFESSSLSKSIVFPPNVSPDCSLYCLGLLQWHEPRPATSCAFCVNYRN